MGKKNGTTCGRLHAGASPGNKPILKKVRTKKQQKPVSFPLPEPPILLLLGLTLVEFVHVLAENRGLSLRMSALIYTQLGVSPVTQRNRLVLQDIQPGKTLNFSHINVYEKKGLPSRMEETVSAANHEN